MTILLLTESFPYEGGEQFLESELDVWGQSGNKVLVLPNQTDGIVRGNWEGCELIRIPKHRRIIALCYGLWRIFLSKILYVELKFLQKNGKLSLVCLYRAMRTGAGIYRKLYIQRYVLHGHRDVSIIYSYWNTIDSYASTMIKQNHIKRVTRLHRFDLYEEQTRYKHHFYKRQFLDKFDLACVLSESAQQYVAEVYNYDRCEVFSLGVSIPTAVPIKPNDEIVRVLSLSYVVSVKRVHKIIDGILDYLTTSPKTRVEWTHIGSGPLQSFVIEYYNQKVKDFSFEARFLGQMSNKEVQIHLGSNYYDVLINTSQSEGVPVSMMEAMSFGIPVIATDVGGVSSLVTNSCGYLVSEEARPEDISKGLIEVTAPEKLLSYRSNARSRIADSYNMNKNYRRFVATLQALNSEA